MWYNDLWTIAYHETNKAEMRTLSQISEHTLVSILDEAADGVIVVDPDQQILFFSKGAERTFGYCRDEVLGRNLSLLLPGYAVNSHPAFVRAFAAGDESRRDMSQRLPVAGRCKDGREFPADVSISKFGDNGQMVFAAVVRDLSARHRATEEAQRWVQVFEHAEWGIGMVRPGSWVLATFNPAFARMHGYTVEELRGRSLRDLVAADAWPDVQELGRQTGHQMFETWHVTKAGIAFPVQVSVTPIKDETGALLYRILNVQDITKRREAEDALRESETRYRSLFENSLDGVLLTAPDGQIFAANPAACSMLGRSEEEICRLGRAGIVDLQDDRLPAALERRAREGYIHVELNLLCSDGTRFPAEISSGLYSDPHGSQRTSMIFRDITNRKRAEAELKEREAQYRGIFEAVVDGILIVTMDGDIVAANPAAGRIYDYAQEEILALKLPDLLQPASRHLLAFLFEAVEAGEVFETEALGMLRDGSQLDIHMHALQLDYRGRSHVLYIIHDISERMQAIQLLEQRVAERTRELRALLEISRKMVSTLALEPLLDILLSEFRGVVDYTGVRISIIEGNELVVLSCRGPVPPSAILHRRIPLDRDTGHRRVVQAQAPLIIDDLWAETPWLQKAWTETDQELDAYLGSVRSWLGVPLIVQGEMAGVLALDHVDRGYFTEEHARLALAFANQAAIAIQNARLYDQAQQAAAYEERHRLARDLHDSVSQALYGIVLGARSASRTLTADPVRTRESLDYLLSLTEIAFAEIRALIFELRPNSLETDGLMAAIKRQSDILSTRHGLQVEADFAHEPEAPIQIKETLYRIAQEATNNIAKHAQASRVALTVEQQPGGILLVVEDDGRGFDSRALAAGHLGLQSMRERATRLGGRFELQSTPGVGTTVTAWIPLP